MDIVLEFERPIVEMQKRIDQLRSLEGANGVNLATSIQQLEDQLLKLQERIYAKISPWQRAMIARHPERPYMFDYVDTICSEWQQIHGDRAGHDDAALVTGVGRIAGQPCVLIGHQKGRNTKENIKRNFGMARPEGYRKALRVMEMANKFRMPIITFIDTPGAYPGIDAEERGQAEAIARNIMEMARFDVPIIAIVIGEGGSGGALAVGVANRVLILENSVYSVISPEGCAAILWRDRTQGAKAAAALRITAEDCKEFGVVDEIIKEPLGCAHRNREQTISNVQEAILRHLKELNVMSPKQVKDDRYARFRAIGPYATVDQ